MRRSFKNLTVTLWIGAVAAMVGMVALQMLSRDRQSAQADGPPGDVADGPGGQGGQGAPPVLAINAPDFSLTDQMGRAVGTGDLKGHPWVADFIFTECTSACPLMSEHLAALQKSIVPEVKFVSFSVDPDHDSPAVLLAYAKQYGADNDRWRFLTGDKTQVYAAVAGMKVSIVQPTTGNQIEHDVHYLLVDGLGRVRGVYDSREPAEIDRLVRDANTLAAEATP
jgi:protein SCO1